MADDAPYFDDRDRLVAPRYGDIYFSSEDGLAETRHVFIEGNRLTERFQAMRPGEQITIGETGFGTGLNFIETWMQFVMHAPSDARLEFLSVEAHPLPADVMRRALACSPAHAAYARVLLVQWGPLWPGVHRFRFDRGRIRLALLVGEAGEVMPSIDASVDAWFLDGFAPARNPQMWSDAVFAQVARLSAKSATFATYTAAGFVRRGLQAAGFEVEKGPGFGRKRDMTVGRYLGGGAAQMLSEPDDRPAADREPAIVIGASLAGSFVARALAERGRDVRVYDAQHPVEGELPTLAPRVAVLQPKVNDAQDNNGSRLREGYAIAERWLRSDPQLAGLAQWNPCGTFQAAYDERSERKARRFVEQFSNTGLCRWIEPSQTLEELGIQLEVGGAVVEHAGLLRPAGLCRALRDHPRIATVHGPFITPLKRTASGWQIAAEDGWLPETDTLVLATGAESNALRLRGLDAVEPRLIRGQVTVLQTPEQAGALGKLMRAIFYGGYLLPEMDGAQTLGASFVKDFDCSGWLRAEHIDVCDKLARVLPDEAERLSTMDNPSGWFGYRMATKSGRACVTQIEPGLYASVGHGSHGIASAAHAGEHLAALITGGVRHRDT